MTATRTCAPKVVDLFSGAGGLSAGFCAEGYELIGALDFWNPACQSVLLNHPNAHVWSGDIRTLSPNVFAESLSARPDVVLGGPSCQGFSTAGGFSRDGRQHNDERNSLFIEFIRFIDVLQPSWVVMENVPGLLLFHRGAVALEIIKQFRIIGYHVVPIILLAADYGVPQLRRRLFFIGSRLGAAVPLPVPSHGDPELWKDFALPFQHLSRLGNTTLAGSRSPHVTFQEACGDLPLIEAGHSHPDGPYPAAASSAYQKLLRKGSRRLTLHYAFELSEFDAAAIEHIRPGENWTSLPSHLKRGRFARIRRYDATTLLRRLRKDRPAYTITTKFNEGTTGAFIHPTQNRTLSIREAARLQSFPDSYKFAGAPVDIRRQIGNAVPPLLARRIAASLLPSIVGAEQGENVKPEATSVLVDPHGPLTQLLGLKDERAPGDEQLKIAL